MPPSKDWWLRRYDRMVKAMEEERRQGGNPDGAVTTEPPQTSTERINHER